MFTDIQFLFLEKKLLPKSIEILIFHGYWSVIGYKFINLRVRLQCSDCMHLVFILEFLFNLWIPSKLVCFCGYISQNVYLKFRYSLDIVLRDVCFVLFKNRKMQDNIEMSDCATPKWDFSYTYISGLLTTNQIYECIFFSSSKLRKIRRRFFVNHRLLDYLITELP